MCVSINDNTDGGGGRAEKNERAFYKPQKIK